VAKSVPRCGKKPDGQRKADFAKWREEQKRKKLEQEDPTYVPEEVPRKKKRNKKSAGNSDNDVRFVFLLFSLSTLMNSSNL
jgi:hypothetical protein